jgi:hypothetical protein
MLLLNFFEAVKKEKELYAHANLRSQMPDTSGLNELLQQWGEAVQDVEDKKVTLGIV